MPRPHLVVALPTIASARSSSAASSSCSRCRAGARRALVRIRRLRRGARAVARGGRYHGHCAAFLKLLDRADTIIIPGWRDANEAPPPELLQRIRSARDRGARLCSICSGVFVLAAAGVLDGKRVTTHWRYAELLGQRYPSVRVEPNALYIDQGQVLTSAGSAAGLDMCYTSCDATTGRRSPTRSRSAS
jgi:transcriptional regulator GlxA family with amidase domain